MLFATEDIETYIKTPANGNKKSPQDLADFFVVSNILFLKKVDSKSANLILEVSELSLTCLSVVCDAVLIELKAHSLEVSNSSVNEVRTDSDMTASAGTSLVHELEGVAREGGLGRALRHAQPLLCSRC